MKEQRFISQPLKDAKLTQAKQKYYDHETDEITHLALLSFVSTLLLNVNTYEDFLPDDFLVWANSLLISGLCLTGFSYWHIRKKMQELAQDINEIDAIKLNHLARTSVIQENLDIILTKRRDLLYEFKSVNGNWVDKLVTSAFSLLTMGSYIWTGHQEDFKNKVFLGMLSTFFGGGIGATSFLLLKNRRKKMDIWRKLTDLENRFEELNDQLPRFKKKELKGGRKTPRPANDQKEIKPPLPQERKTSKPKASEPSTKNDIAKDQSQSNDFLKENKNTEPGKSSSIKGNDLKPAKSLNQVIAKKPPKKEKEKEEEKEKGKETRQFRPEETGWNRSQRQVNIARGKNKKKSDPHNYSDCDSHDLSGGLFVLEGFNLTPPVKKTHHKQEQKNFSNAANSETHEVKAAPNPQKPPDISLPTAQKLPVPAKQSSEFAAPKTLAQSQPIVSSLHAARSELNQIVEKSTYLEKYITQTRQNLTYDLQLLHGEIDIFDKNLDNFKKNLILKRFYLSDLKLISTPGLKRSLAELVKLKSELEDLRATVYLHGSFFVKCCTYLLTGKILEAKDIDVVIELPKGLPISRLLEKVPLANRAFSFSKIQTDFKPDPRRNIPQSCNLVSNDKDCVKIDLVIREEGYIPNFDPFDLTNCRLDFASDEDSLDADEVYFVPDESKLPGIREDILNSIFPVQLYDPCLEKNIRNFLPRLAKYLVRFDGELTITSYFRLQNGQKVYLSPEDFQQDLIKFFQDLFADKMSWNSLHYFFGMQKTIREGHFTHSAVRKIILPFCAGLLAVTLQSEQYNDTPGTAHQDLSVDTYTAANNMATILQCYFKENPQDAKYFKLITDILLSEDAIKGYAELNNEELIDMVKWLKYSVNHQLFDHTHNSVVSVTTENSTSMQDYHSALSAPESPTTVFKLKELKSSCHQSSNPYSKFHVRKTPKKTENPLNPSPSVSQDPAILPQSGPK